MVRRTREFTIKGVNFSELRKKEKTALKTNPDEEIREEVDAGSYISPNENKKLFATRTRPRNT